MSINRLFTTSDVAGEVYATFKPTEAEYVYQGEAVFTSNDSDKPILVSSNATACLLISGFNKLNNFALLAHADMNTQPDSLCEMIKKLKRNEQDEILVDLVGGNESSRILILHEILPLIRNMPNVVIRTTDFYFRGGNHLIRSYNMLVGAALSIDARTGNIERIFSEEQLAMDKVALEKNRRKVQEQWKQVMKERYDGGFPLAARNEEILTSRTVLKPG